MSNTRQLCTERFLEAAYNAYRDPYSPEAKPFKSLSREPENQLASEVVKTTYKQREDYPSFAARSRHMFDIYSRTVDTATIVSTKNGASLDIPLSPDNLGWSSYTVSKYDVERLLINGFDDVDPSNLKILPSHKEQLPIHNITLNTESDRWCLHARINNIDFQTLDKCGGTVTIQSQDLKSKPFDKLRDWYNANDYNRSDLSLLNTENPITMNWYGYGRQKSGYYTNVNHGMILEIKTPDLNKPAKYFVENYSDKRECVTLYKLVDTPSLNIQTLRRCLNTVEHINQTRTLTLALDTPQALDVPPITKLPESIQNKLTSINQVRDSIEQEVLKTKLERVDNAIEIYQELSQAYPTKASTYLERFENALDNVKASLDTKLESHIEHNALDFEVALRMLELDDNLSQ